MNIFKALAVNFISNSFAAKFDMVIHDHKLECHAKQFGCCLQGQGHRAYTQKITFLIHLMK